MGASRIRGCPYGPRRSLVDSAPEPTHAACVARLDFLSSPWISIGAALASLIWLAWALWGRKPKHPECLRCGHDLTAQTSDCCSECGRPVRSRRELVRRRRRPRMAIAATLLLGAGIVGMTQTVPSAWWVPRLPTTVLFVLAGRWPDEATTLDLVSELTDRLSLSDGYVTWSEVPRLPAWQQAMIEPAIVRLESMFAGRGSFAPLRQLAGCTRAADDAPPPSPATEIVLADTPQDLVDEINATRLSDSDGDRRLRDVVAALERRGISLQEPIPDADVGLVHAALLPVVSGSPERDCVVRIGLLSYSGHGFWFHRAHDGRWRTVGVPCDLPGPIAYRTGPDNVVAHVVGANVILEVEEHNAGGSDFFQGQAVLIDARSGREVLRVPKEFSEGHSERQSSISTSFSWPDPHSANSLDVTARVQHRMGDDIVASMAFTLHYRRAGSDEPFVAQSINWISPPPTGLDDPTRVPFLWGWLSTDDELASFYGIDPSTLADER